MGDMLKDFRGKITAETWCAIEAEHRLTGNDHSAIVREILHGWALRKIEESSVLSRLLAGEGIDGSARELTGRSR